MRRRMPYSLAAIHVNDIISGKSNNIVNGYSNARGAIIDFFTRDLRNELFNLDDTSFYCFDNHWVGICDDIKTYEFFGPGVGEDMEMRHNNIFAFPDMDKFGSIIIVEPFHKMFDPDDEMGDLYRSTHRAYAITKSMVYGYTTDIPYVEDIALWYTAIYEILYSYRFKYTHEFIKSLAKNCIYITGTDEEQEMISDIIATDIGGFFKENGYIASFTDEFLAGIQTRIFIEKNKRKK